MPITIDQERPDTPDAVALITELTAYLEPLSPPESRHGLSVTALLDQGVHFFVVRENGVAAGCGGLLYVGADYAEVKRMYVRPAFRNRGLGAMIIDYLEARARARGLPMLRLETGIAQTEAQRLYERCGFRQSPPFGPYRLDPWSRFYEKPLPAV